MQKSWERLNHYEPIYELLNSQSHNFLLYSQAVFQESVELGRNFETSYKFCLLTYTHSFFHVTLKLPIFEETSFIFFKIFNKGQNIWRAIIALPDEE